MDYALDDRFWVTVKLLSPGTMLNVPRMAALKLKATHSGNMMVNWGYRSSTDPRTARRQVEIVMRWTRAEYVKSGEVNPYAS